MKPSKLILYQNYMQCESKHCLLLDIDNHEKEDLITEDKNTTQAKSP